MITLYTHDSAPNGWKVVIVMIELGIEYESVYLDFKEKEHKGAEFLRINPNGRIPAIIDHDNDDFTIWESGAIVHYLVDRYDKDHKISFPRGSAESYLAAQWVAFQISGQGPYIGQAYHFLRNHPEKIESAITRYVNETDRIIGVLDGVLAERKYLVGNKVSIADIMFYPWNRVTDLVVEEYPALDLGKYVNYKRWDDDLAAWPSIAKAYAERAGLKAEAK